MPEFYPDSDDTTSLGDGVDTMYDRAEFKYNRQGQVIWKKDQNGTIHEFVHDALGRQTTDKVTTLAAGLDNSVLRVAKTFEVRGMVDKITSHDAAAGGSVVNEVVLEYDTAGNLSKEYQEHSGAKDANTLYVQYNRDTSSSGGDYTKGLRPTSLRYPNGRLVHFTYSASDAINRVDAIKDDNAGSPGSSLAEYSYLGAATIVKEDFTEPDVRLDYAAGAGDDPHDGFDRFGRVVDQLWYDYGASADRDRYTYDSVNRLATFDRGDLNGGKTAITGTPVREEDWSLDPTGNWTDFIQKTSGSTDLDQDRAQNAVNEITNITETTGTAWITPVHDAAGNMTTVPKPSSLSNGLTLKYDAWNRLASVTDDTTVVAIYEYDARNRRVKKHLDSQSPSSPNGVDAYIHYFYSHSWQILETRDTTTESDQPENLQPKHQHVWSLRYIDSPILRDENTDTDSLCDDQRHYYLSDASFNITGLTDTAGDAVERYIYTPYGKVTIHNGAWSSRSSSSYNNAHLYSGREYDPETELYHYRNRYYSIELGRFISRDIMRYVDGFGLYLYAQSSPVRYRDPSGLVTQADIENDIGPIMDACPAIKKLREEIRKGYKGKPPYVGEPDNVLPPQYHVGPIPGLGLPVNASDMEYGVIALDPGAGRCETIETILIELHHLKNRSVLMATMGGMCNMTRDDYIRKIEELEFNSLQGTADVWKQCAKNFKCNVNCPTYGNPDDVLGMTFEEHFRKLPASSTV